MVIFEVLRQAHILTWAGHTLLVSYRGVVIEAWQTGAHSQTLIPSPAIARRVPPRGRGL